VTTIVVIPVIFLTVIIVMMMTMTEASGMDGSLNGHLELPRLAIATNAIQTADAQSET
jgi:hypothetical protein